MTEPIRLAIAGAGLFVRDAHIPAIQALGDRFRIVAIYSRTRASAEAAQALLPYPVDIYTELDPMLARADVEAVDVALPVEPLPEAVEKALAAGKHVISEKPVSPDVATGRGLIEFARAYPGQQWMVAENDRFEAAYQRAGELIRAGAIGRPLLASWLLPISVKPDNKYYHTPWRRSGTWPGGFLLDGGVHHSAIFRTVLGEIASVSAQVKQMREDLPPADTVSASLLFASGALGSYTITYASGAPFRTAVEIIGEDGALRVNHGMLEVSEGGSMRGESIERGDAVQTEFAAFADAVREGTPHRNSPLEALRDVAVVEAILKSGETGERVAVEDVSDLGAAS
jgi:predicted dehydrogenase